jgi:hypothetical protein
MDTKRIIEVVFHQIKRRKLRKVSDEVIRGSLTELAQLIGCNRRNEEMENGDNDAATDDDDYCDDDDDNDNNDAGDNHHNYHNYGGNSGHHNLNPRVNNNSKDTIDITIDDLYKQMEARRMKHGENEEQEDDDDDSDDSSDNSGWKTVEGRKKGKVRQGNNNKSEETMPLHLSKVNKEGLRSKPDRAGPTMTTNESNKNMILPRDALSYPTGITIATSPRVNITPCDTATEGAICRTTDQQHITMSNDEQRATGTERTSRTTPVATRSKSMKRKIETNPENITKEPPKPRMSYENSSDSERMDVNASLDTNGSVYQDNKTIHNSTFKSCWNINLNENTETLVIADSNMRTIHRANIPKDWQLEVFPGMKLGHLANVINNLSLNSDNRLTHIVLCAGINERSRPWYNDPIQRDIKNSKKPSNDDRNQSSRLESPSIQTGTAKNKSTRAKSTNDSNPWEPRATWFHCSPQRRDSSRMESITTLQQQPRSGRESP